MMWVALEWCAGVRTRHVRSFKARYCRIRFISFGGEPFAEGKDISTQRKGRLGTSCASVQTSMDGSARSSDVTTV